MARFRERSIVLPTFAQLGDPTLIPERVTARLSDVEVSVSVRLEPLRMSSQTIGRLTAGDVLSFGHRTTAPMIRVSRGVSSISDGILLFQDQSGITPGQAMAVNHGDFHGNASGLAG